MQGAKHSDTHRYREHLQRRSAPEAGEPNVQLIPQRVPNEVRLPRDPVIAYLPDNEPFQRLRASAEPTGTNREESMDFARKQDEKLLEFIQNSEVLIIDAQYDCSEYEQHTGWGHGCTDDVVALAMDANVKRLFLFHHDPTHDDAKISEMVVHARKLVAAGHGALHVEAAREGATVQLPFSKIASNKHPAGKRSRR